MFYRRDLKDESFITELSNLIQILNYVFSEFIKIVKVFLKMCLFEDACELLSNLSLHTHGQECS